MEPVNGDLRVAENAPAPLALLDAASLALRAASRAFAEAVGRAPAELAGRTLAEIAGPRFAERVLRAAAEPEARRFEARLPGAPAPCR